MQATVENNAMRRGRTAMVCARRIALAVAVLLAVLVTAPRQAAAASLVPFHATIAETFTAAPCAPVPSLCVTIMGSGHATHLGHVHEFAAVYSDLASHAGPGCFTETRTTILTAANGDQLTLVSTGHHCVTSPTTETAVDAYVVAAGTGRFRGATGSGTNTAIIDLASGTAVVTFSGLLSSPGSLR